MTPIAFIQGVIGRPVYLVGSSDGAIVALEVGGTMQAWMRRLVFVGGVFHRDGWEDGVLDDESPEFFRQSYTKLHRPNGISATTTWSSPSWRRCTRSSPRCRRPTGRKIEVRTLIMIGDDDQVRLEHATAMYRTCPTPSFAVVPGTSHGLLVQKPALCNLIITEFLTTDPVETFAPIRRAANPPRG